MGMSSSPVDRFRCPACGKQFAWKSELEGKQVKCKCGRTFAATRAMPHAATKPVAPKLVDNDGELDLYPDSDPKPVGTVVRRPVETDDDDEPADNVHTATPLPTPAVLAAYPGLKRRVVTQEEGDDEQSTLKNVIIPVVFAFLGICGWAIVLSMFPFRGVDPSKMVIMAAVMLGVNLLVVLLALFTVAAMLGVNFGSPKSAVSKVAGMSVLASAIMIAAVRMDYPEIRGAIAGFHVVLLFYWLAFSALFDLELQETVITIAIVGLVQAMAGCVVLKV